VPSFVDEGGLERVAERFIKAGVYALTPEQASSQISSLASKLGIDLTKANLEETRRSLAKGTPLSKVILEMREE